MDAHALGLLEFSRVLDELRGLCASPAGAQLLGEQEFLNAFGQEHGAHRDPDEQDGGGSVRLGDSAPQGHRG